MTFAAPITTEVGRLQGCSCYSESFRMSDCTCVTILGGARVRMLSTHRPSNTALDESEEDDVTRRR